MIATSTLLATLRACLEPREEILEAYLFGSAATGSAQAHSDVDVAVYLREPPSQYGGSSSDSAEPCSQKVKRARWTCKRASRAAATRTRALASSIPLSASQASPSFVYRAGHRQHRITTAAWPVAF